MAGGRRTARHAEDQTRAFIDDFARMRDTPEWQAELARNGWKDVFLSGDDFRKYLVEQDRQVESSLRELGLV